jgi:hypothetical protein
LSLLNETPQQATVALSVGKDTANVDSFTLASSSEPNPIITNTAKSPSNKSQNFRKKSRNSTSSAVSHTSQLSVPVTLEPALNNIEINSENNEIDDETAISMSASWNLSISGGQDTMNAAGWDLDNSTMASEAHWYGCLF